MTKIGRKCFAFPAVVDAIWNSERTEMLGFRRILHAIREHFANPYVAAERFRSSANLDPSMKRIGTQRNASNLKDGSRHLIAITHLLDKAPPIPLGFGSLLLSAVILMETWGYPRQQQSFLVCIYILCVEFVFVGSLFIASRLLSRGLVALIGHEASGIFALNIVLYIAGFIASIYFWDHAILIGLPTYCGLMLLGAIKRYCYPNDD